MKGGFILLQDVNIEKIKDIRERLKEELNDKDLPFQRKKEIKSIIKLYTKLIREYFRKGVRMYPIYKCLNCGRIWRSGEIMVICPVCRSKPIKIKEGVDIKEVMRIFKKEKKRGFK